MSLIREGRTKSYFESCGHARPAHACVYRETHTHYRERDLHLELVLFENSSSFANQNGPRVFLLPSIHSLQKLDNQWTSKM